MKIWQTILAFIGGGAVLAAAIWCLTIGYNAIKASGAEEAKVELQKELVKAKSTVRTADEMAKKAEKDMDDAKKAKTDADSAKVEAEAAKKASEVEKTLLMSQRRAFVATVRAVYALETAPSRYISCDEYRYDLSDDRCKLAKRWLTWAGLSFSKTGVKVGEQSFTFVRDAEGNVSDLKIEEVVAPAKGTSTKLNGKVAVTNDNY